MRTKKSRLLSTTVIPVLVLVSLAVGGAAVTNERPVGPAQAAGNPCAPCAAGGARDIPNCAVPRLRAAAANPSAAAKACNPCGANGLGNPCRPEGAVRLSDAEAIAAYDCLLKEMRAAYARSGDPVAIAYGAWRRYSRNAYVSESHGDRYVQNYANPAAKSYGAYEDAGVMPAGAILAKDSFEVDDDGRVSVGPLFIMEKMPAGFYEDSGDWRYTLITPDGEVFGTTKGKGTAKVEYCIGCHAAVAPGRDSLMLLPGSYRVK